jgi:hypothetical protein
MKTNVFMGYLMRGIINVLSSFGHEQYHSNKIDPWCLIIEHRNDEGTSFHVGFGRAMQYPSTCQKICYGAQCIFKIP